MHSSRIHTVRCSGRLGGEGEGCLPRGVSAPGMAAWEQCVCPGGAWGQCVCPGGVCLGRCVSARECLPRRCLPGWVYTPQTQGQTPLPVNRITDRCRNITFPQLLLWTVINPFSRRPTTRLPLGQGRGGGGPCMVREGAWAEHRVKNSSNRNNRTTRITTGLKLKVSSHVTKFGPIFS